MAKDKQDRRAYNGSGSSSTVAAYTNRNRLEEANLPSYSKLPPQAPDLEEAILSAILIEREAMTKVLDIIRAESFYKPAHQEIYRSMRRLFERSQPIDLLLVVEDLRKHEMLEMVGGAGYLAQLTSRVTSSANIEYHARIVTEKFIQRELIRTSSEVIKEAYEDSTDVLDLLDKAGSNLFSITEENMGKQVADMGSLANQLLEQLKELRSREGGLTGVATGFTDLDRLTSGLQKSDLIIVAARPAMGKTSFVLSMARNAALGAKADHPTPVAIFSLEMSAAQLAGRIFSQDAEVNGQKMRNGKFTEEEWERLVNAMNHVGEAPIYIDDTPGINVFELRAKCRRLKLEKKIGMVIIDYLQLMSGAGEGTKGGNREQEVSAISRSLKGLAKELEVPVIALSQLSRAVETRGGDKRPQLSDLRESGCLTGDSLVTLAEDGRRVPIKELVARYPRGGFQVWATDDEYKLVPAMVSAAFSTGIKQTHRLTTQSGRTVRATENHKFLTIRGWKRLDELGVGERVAVVEVAHTEVAFAESNGDITNNYGYDNSTVTLPESQQLTLEATSDIYWDPITTIEPDTIEEVYDLTVPGPHNFVADGIVVHNSIEQDADMVMFLYRPEYYKITEDEQGNSLAGVAEVIVGKNRHGEARDIRLKFDSDFARFSDLEDLDFDLLPSGAITGGQPQQPYGGGTLPSKMNTDDDIPF